MTFSLASRSTYSSLVLDSISTRQPNLATTSLVRFLFASRLSSPDATSRSLPGNRDNVDEDELFDSLTERNTSATNSDPVKLCHDGRDGQALDSLRRMRRLGVKPTKYELCGALSSCCRAQETRLGMQIHAHILHSGHEKNLFLGSKLVHLYSESGAMLDAKRVFDGMQDRDWVAWTSIISGLAQNGCGGEALERFKEMLTDEARPNSFTFASLVNACTSMGSAIEQGRSVHALAIKLGCEVSTYVRTSLIDFYSKVGDIDAAMSVFESSSARDTAIYNSMITGYTQNMLGEDALKLFMDMRVGGVTHTDSTFASILNACGILVAHLMGKQLHSLTTKIGSDRNVFVATALLDMYSKCGDIHQAYRVFDNAFERNNTMWTSMIMGCAQNGRGAEGLKLFDQLIQGDGKPDNICFTSVLTACNHAGLLVEGLRYFELMKGKYGLVPDLDHFACVVDLYGRTGHLREARDFMGNMPFQPNAVMLSSFMGFCRFYGETELAEKAAEQLINIHPDSAAPYIILANNHAKIENWKEAAIVRGVMRSKSIRKKPGLSWV